LEADDGRCVERQCAVRVGSRPENVVATTADNQHHRPRRVGVNGYDIVSEQAVDARRVPCLSLRVHLLVQVDVEIRQFCTRCRVHHIDQWLHVRVKAYRRLWLGADVGQEQARAADQGRLQLIGIDTLRGLRDRGAPGCGIEVRAEQRAR